MSATAQSSRPTFGAVVHQGATEKKTNRSTFLKLELVGDTRSQLEAVKDTLYNIDLPAAALSVPAHDSIHWKVTDDILYSEAKSSYDNIINSLLASPRVYKLEAMREKRSAMKIYLDQPLIQEIPRAKHSRKQKRKKDIATIIVSEEESYIDPFVAGQYEEVWKEKLQLLEKLTPCEDLDGYEYRENYEEQQYRLSLQQDFQDRLAYEVRRRAEEPTDEEEVEDVLYDMIERVVGQHRQMKKLQRLEEQRHLQESKNPVISGFKMKKLASIEGLEGDVTRMISDADYVDVLISKAGLILPRYISNQIIAQRKEEKRLIEALKKKAEEDREAQRRLPLSTKLRSAVLMAKGDLSGSVRQFMRDAIDKTIILPSKPLREKCAEIVTQGSQGLIELAKDPQSVLDTVVDYVLDTYDRITDINKLPTKTYTPQKKNKRLLDLKDLRIEAQKRLQSNVDDLSQEVDDNSIAEGTTAHEFPDSILVKFLLNTNLPPAYVFRPKKTVKKEMKKWKRKTLTSLGEKREKFQIVLNNLLSKAKSDKKQDESKTISPTIVRAIENDPNYHAIVHTKDIVWGKNYTGYLRPEHMFVYEQEDQEEGDKTVFVYDSSERQAFESSLLHQISFASCIPIVNLRIEEIRRLEVDASSLIKAKEAKEQELIKSNLRNEIKELEEAARRAERKAMMKGQFPSLLDWQNDLLTDIDKIEGSLFSPPGSMLRQRIADLPASALQPSDTTLQTNLPIEQVISKPEDSEDGDATKDEIFYLIQSMVSTVEIHHGSFCAKVGTETLPKDGDVEESVKRLINDIISQLEEQNPDFLVRSILNDVLKEVVELNPDPRETCASLLLSLIENIESKYALDAQQTEVDTFASANLLQSSTMPEPSGQSNLSLLLASNFPTEASGRIFQEGLQNDGMSEISTELPTIKADKFLRFDVGEESEIDKGENSSDKNDTDRKKDIDTLINDFKDNFIVVGSKASALMVADDKFGISQPVLPQSPSIGIRNPRDLKYDTDYWQNAYIRELSKDEKRKMRLQRLPMLRDYYDMMNYGKVYLQAKQQIRELKHLKEEWKEDIMEVMGPLMSEMSKVFEKSKPYLQFLDKEFYSLVRTIRILMQRLLMGGKGNAAIFAPKIIEALNKIDEATRQSITDPSCVDAEEKERIYQEVIAYMQIILDEVEGRINNDTVCDANKDQLSVLQNDQTPSLGKGGQLGRSSNVPDNQEIRSQDINVDVELADKGERVKSQSSSSKLTPTMRESGESLEVTESQEGEVDKQEGSEKDRLEDDGERIDGESKVLKDSGQEGEEGTGNRADEPNDGTEKTDAGEISNPDEEEVQVRENAKGYEDENPGEEEEDEGEDEEDEEDEEQDENEEEDEDEVEDDTVEKPSDDQFRSNILSAISHKSSRTIGNLSNRYRREQSSSLDVNNAHQQEDFRSEEDRALRQQRDSFISAFLNGGAWLENPQKADEKFWEDLISQDLYDKSIVEFLHDACQKVEIDVQNFLKEEEERKARSLFGCEISVIITVKDEQREVVPGLHDLRSEDIVAFLYNQLYDSTSVLNSMDMTKNIMSMSVSPLYDPRDPFTQWTSYWTYIIHPSFFTYSSQKPIKKDENTDSLTIYSKNLAPGLKIVNPIDTLSERTKQAFQAISSKPLLRSPGERKKRTDDDDDEPEEMLEFGGADQSNRLIEFNIDEFAKQKGKKLFRPNMEQLTPKDIERLLRVYRDCKNTYEIEMLPGLINNAMKPTQFEALKNLEASFRIYRTAKQRFERSLRQAAADSGSIDSNAVIPLKVTHIEQEQYDQWLEEVREEDRQRLKEHREHAEKVREELKHEAKLRREAEHTKMVLMEGFITYYKEHQPSDDHQEDDTEHDIEHLTPFAQTYPGMFDLYGHYYHYVHDALELDQALRSELDKPFTLESVRENFVEVNPLPAVQDVLVQTNDSSVAKDPVHNIVESSPLDVVIEKKKLRISEEKKTRRLFTMMQAVEVQVETDGHIFLNRSGKENAESLDVHVSSQDVASFIIDCLIDNVIIFVEKGKVDDLGINQSSMIEKERVLKFIDFVSSVLFQMDTLKHSVQYATFLKDNPIMKNSRRTRQQQSHQQLHSSHSADRKLPTPIPSKTTKLPNILESPPVKSDKVQKPHSHTPDESDSKTGDGDEENIITVSEEDADHMFNCTTIEHYELLSREEWGFLRELRWLKAVREHPPFFDCLKHFSTMKDTHFMKDELVQFASLLVDLYPLYRQVVASLNKQKYDAEVALGIHKKKKVHKHKRHHRHHKNQKHEEEHEEQEAEDPQQKLERLKQEEILRLEEVRKKAERDKAWFMAHPHRFLRPIDNLKGPVFCIICVQKAHEYWLKTREDDEAKWKINLPKFLKESLERIEGDLRKETEEEKKLQYEREASEMVKKLMEEEGVLQKPLPEDDEEETGREETQSQVSLSSADEDMLKWEADMSRTVDYMKRKQISFIDGRGLSILPPRPVQKPISTVISTENVTIEMIKRGMEIDESIPEPPGIKIMIFHRNDLGERSKFLGTVELSEKDLKRPPKGMRLYLLKEDDSIVDPDPVPVQGQLALALAVHIKKGKVGGPGLPNKPSQMRLKLTLKKLSKLHMMSLDDLTNPYCEVYWKGPAKRNEEVVQLREYTLIGQTKSKVRTIEVIYNHREENDDSIFDFPPVYTLNNIPHRGLKESDIHFGGGYVARNMIPAEDSIEGSEITTKSGKTFTFGSSASTDEVQRDRTHVKYKELLLVEIKLRSEGIKLIKLAEERERQYMNEEEKHQREVDMSALKLSYAPALKIQENFARDFQKLLENIVNPSSLLNRLRFLMGEDNMEVSFPNYPHLTKNKGSAWKGSPNSLVIRCEDCSTNDVVRVVCTPILNKEDEESMSTQVLSLVGRLSLHNLKILDFAVHDLTTYDDKGFRAIHERMAVIITEHVEGPVILDYLLEHWDEVQDKELLQLLLQIIKALVELHEANIVHRNLSPHAIQLTFPQNKVKRGQQQKLIQIKLGSYWFLENPRNIACQSSEGRADWGNILTVPPEVATAPKQKKLSREMPAIAKVSDKSDVFALGVCIFYWATKGILLPVERYYQANSIKVLKPYLPLKWGSWLSTLLGMCLIVDPKCRPSAKELMIFLKAIRL